ncbi:MAG TPA: thioredoxin domain-containing protein [Pseudolysinimonas sp.]|nr:thioredoxin domain-containing protein [Pseudolysinimonas sp.]
MPDLRPTKNEKRDAAREQARLTREKQKRQERLRRWLIPSGVTVVVLAIVAIVVLVVSSSGPAPQTAAGPKNMISDGILFTGVNGTITPTTTPAIKAKGTPTPTVYPNDGLAHIVTYVDFACPVCQAFEAANAAQIDSLVKNGQATLEVHPVAILDRSSLGARYSSRANDAGACVANFAPDSFLDVMTEFYAKQPAEQTTGLTNTQIISLVHSAGLRNADVDACIKGESFKSWLAAATNRATSNPKLLSPSSGQFGTPTVLVNGKYYTGSVTDAASFSSFIQQALAG